jgi:hypothetical protein
MKSVLIVTGLNASETYPDLLKRCIHAGSTGLTGLTGSTRAHVCHNIIYTSQQDCKCLVCAYYTPLTLLTLLTVNCHMGLFVSGLSFATVNPCKDLIRGIIKALVRPLATMSLATGLFHRCCRLEQGLTPTLQESKLSGYRRTAGLQALPASRACVRNSFPYILFG